MSDSKKNFVNLSNAKRGNEYEKVIEEIQKHAVCPFCPENISKYHKNPIEKRTHWLVTNNMYPYKPVNHHILLIHAKHIEHISEITPEAWVELKTILDETTEKKPITGGSLMLRFGNTNFTGASVTHLHAHIIQSNPDDKEYDKAKGLMVRLG